MSTKMKTMMTKTMAGLMAVVLLLGVVLIGQPAATAEAKTKLSKSKATICVGETLALKMSGTTKKVTWKSTKKSVAVVDKNGVVTGKKKGSSVIKGSVGGKSYSCKITVKSLPKSYATVNGKKVKVGGKVKITYKLTAPTPVSDVSARYYFYEDQMKIVTSSDDKMRFKTWAFFNGYDAMPVSKEYKSEFKGMTKGKNPMQCFHQCAGLSPKKDNVESYPVSCKKGKVFDSFYVKVLTHGNYTFKATFDVSNKGKKVKKYTLTETVK